MPSALSTASMQAVRNYASKCGQYASEPAWKWEGLSSEPRLVPCAVPHPRFPPERMRGGGLDCAEQPWSRSVTMHMPARHKSCLDARMSAVVATQLAPEECKRPGSCQPAPGYQLKLQGNTLRKGP
eukprot:356133-Chlamydomonas_euryale.AAC.2